MFRLFDAHSDLFEDVYEKRSRGLTDIIKTGHSNKWMAGGCIGGFYPVWVDPFCEVYDLPVEDQAKGMIQCMQEELASCGDAAAKVTNIAEYEAALAAGRHAVFLGTEGLSFLRGDSGGLDQLYALGMREFSLTWNETNEFAAGAADNSGRGLTSAGYQCVRRIRDLNALLDLAHAGRKTFYDAVSVIDGSFMVSHGNIEHFCRHPRNLTDEQLRVIRDYKGVIGISAYAPFLSENNANRDVGRMCDNIEYVADKAGIECVGLGFDLVDFLDDVGEDKSISYVTKGFESISCGQNISAELRRRGFTDADIDKVYHANFERLIKTVIG